MQRSEREERERDRERNRQPPRPEQRLAPATIDLLKDGFPFEPGGWYMAIEPITPMNVSRGGIVLAEISQQAEGYQATVGRVLKCGPSAFEGKTTSGIDLSNFLPGVRSAKELIGKYVIYQQHTGQLLVLRATGQRIILLKLTDLLGATDDPQAWKFYV
jgi:hypothetical protein